MGYTYIGIILAWAGLRLPSGFAWCNGQIMTIQSNPALYSLIGIKYGGDGITNFALPDLRCRFPLGMANTQPPSGTVQALGSQGGQETLALSTLNLPQHTHAASMVGGALAVSASLQASSNSGTTQAAQGNYIANGNYPGGSDSTGQFTMPAATCNTFVPQAQAGDLQAVAGLSVSASLAGAAINVAMTGSGTPIPTQPMYTVVNYIICTAGLYPTFE